MKCYRKNGSDVMFALEAVHQLPPSMKCYRKNGSDREAGRSGGESAEALNEVLPKER